MKQIKLINVRAGYKKTPKRWTKEEHSKFVEAFRTHGKDWVRVQKAVVSKDGL